MLEVSNIKVRSLDVDFTEITWKIKDTAEDVLDYQFEILRSESAAGPWDKLSDPFKDRFIFYDRFTRPFNAFRALFYAVRVTHVPTGDFKDFGPEQQEAEADLIAKELRRHMALLFREFTGRRCWLLPVRTFGQRCTCFHQTLQKRTRSGCTLCFDTGFVRGYLHPIELFAQIDPQDTKKDTVTQVGTTQQLNTSARIVNIGNVKPRDILIEAENIRWRVVAVNQTEQVRSPIHFELQLHRIPQSDVEYNIPLQMDEALKDLWLSPARNFTNPHNLSNFEDEEIPKIFSLYGTTYTDPEAK